jgi:hypothetical protein
LTFLVKIVKDKIFQLKYAFLVIWLNLKKLSFLLHFLLHEDEVLIYYLLFLRFFDTNNKQKVVVYQKYLGKSLFELL